MGSTRTKVIAVLLLAAAAVAAAFYLLDPSAERELSPAQKPVSLSKAEQHAATREAIAGDIEQVELAPIPAVEKRAPQRNSCKQPASAQSAARIADPFADIKAPLIPDDCCTPDHAEEVAKLALDCDSYLDSLNDTIALSKSWPTDFAQAHAGQLARCHNVRRAHNANLRRLPLTSNTSDYAALTIDFKNQDWKEVVRKIEAGHPTTLTDRPGEPGVEKNAVQLAVVFGAPDEIIDRLVKRGLEIPDYVVPLALKEGRLSTYKKLIALGGRSNALTYNGRPTWALGFLTGLNDGYGAELLANGADFSIPFKIGSVEGDILHHYLAQQIERGMPESGYTAAHVKAMIQGGAKVTPAMLRMDLPAEIRNMLLAHIAQCGES